MDSAEKTGLKGFLNFLEKVGKEYQKSVLNAALFFISGGLEQIIESVFGECPSDLKAAHDYSLVVLIIPPCILFLMGLVLQEDVWYAVFGRRCCCRDGIDRDFCRAILSALILPLGWLVFAGIDGDFIACYYAVSKDSKSFLEYKYKSSLYTWWFVFGIAVFFALVICCCNCFSNQTYYESKYKGMLKEKKRSHILQTLEECSTNTAKEQAKGFSKASELKQEDWQKMDDGSKAATSIPTTQEPTAQEPK